MTSEIHQTDRQEGILGGDATGGRHGEKVQCIPRHIRKWAWLRYRVIPGDAVEGLS